MDNVLDVIEYEHVAYYCDETGDMLPDRDCALALALLEGDHEDA